MNRKGFTLVGLLVTIAIISLVVGLSVFGIVNLVRNSENKTIINLYIGIRADEAQRVKTATSNNPNIKEQFLFVRDGLIKKDIIEILNNSGLGLPRYMEWKSRSGCFFCFYQSKLEWINLYERHPELYKKAMNYEFKNCKKIKNGSFGWRSDITLEEMIKPENIKKIKENYAKMNNKKNKENADRLIDLSYLCHSELDSESYYLYKQLSAG